MADLQDNLNEAPTMVELCSTIARLSRQLQKEKHKNPELVAAACHAIGGTAAGLHIPATPTSEVVAPSYEQLVNLHAI